MGGAMRRLFSGIFLLVLLCATGLTGGCASRQVATEVPKNELPPLLAQDEVLRPYQKVAVVEVTRRRYGSPSDISPEDYNAVYDALRAEACRIGADAVIFPEVKVESDNFYGFPRSEMRGKGTAIRFQ